MQRITRVGTLGRMPLPPRFDVLVIGSGASGLAAAVAADRAGAKVALASKSSLQANNSSKAQGGIQAAFADDDSPELHAEDVMRSSHDTADPRLVEALTGDAQGAIHWLEELGCAFTRENGGYPVARFRRAPPHPVAGGRGCASTGERGGCGRGRGGGPPRKRLLRAGARPGRAFTRPRRDARGAGSARGLPARARAPPGEPRRGGRASFSVKDGGTAV